MLQKIKTKRKQKTEQKEIKGPVKTLFIGSNPYLLTALLSIQFYKSPSFFPIKLFTSIQWVHWYAIPFTEAKHPLGGPKRIFYYPSGPLSLPAVPNLTKFLFIPFFRLRPQQLVFWQLSRFDFLNIQSKVLWPLTYQNYQQSRQKLVTFLEK